MNTNHSIDQQNLVMCAKELLPVLEELETILKRPVKQYYGKIGHKRMETELSVFFCRKYEEKVVHALRMYFRESLRSEQRVLFWLYIYQSELAHSKYYSKHINDESIHNMFNILSHNAYKDHPRKENNDIAKVCALIAAMWDAYSESTRTYYIGHIMAKQQKKCQTVIFSD